MNSHWIVTKVTKRKQLEKHNNILNNEKKPGHQLCFSLPEKKTEEMILFSVFYYYGIIDISVFCNILITVHYFQVNRL